jgi:CDP-diacylglycerol---serine O-phosphatidyltransferase
MGDFQQERAFAKNRIRRRGIYLLPNLFTTAALFAGFWAIVQAMNFKFDWAAKAVFVAMVLDSLDGRVARLTRTQSAFGAEYDSLSDMVCFGAAPALVIYEWTLRPWGNYGWLAAFLYCACAALRLARFNTNLEVADKRFFQGLPSPAAAALVTGFVWTMEEYAFNPDSLAVRGWAMAVTVFAGVCMVSNFNYYSFKTINLRRRVSFVVVLLVVLSFVLVSFQPPAVLFCGFVGYALSGGVGWAWLAWKRRRGGRQAGA